MEEYFEEIKSIWDSHWLTNMGPKHNELKEKLKEYLRVSNVELVVNGHMALEVAIQSLGLTGDVITTPFTFVSTTHAIMRSGLNPVFCDIDPETCTIDPEGLEKVLTKDTSAILPVHVYGNICNIEAIGDFAKKHGLKVIYDAAHTFGETYKGKGAGSFGDASCFSFHATKVFNTVEGGCICYDDESLADSLYAVKDFGFLDPDDAGYTRTNAKMKKYCTAMGLCNIRYIDEYIKERRRVYDRYNERLDGVKGLKLNPVQKDVESNYAYYPVFIDPAVFGADRDEVFDRLGQCGIMARKYFYPAVNAMACYRDRFDPSLTPAADRVSRQVLTLPMYSELKNDDVDRICDAVINTANR